jgi:hypothetical protein
MRYFSSILVTLLIAAALPSAVPAQTTYTYTIQGQVSASGVPAGAAINVGCYTFPNTTGTGSSIAFAQVTFNASSTGSYSGNYSLQLSGSTKPQSYVCRERILPPNSGQILNFDNNNNPIAGWTGTMVTTAAIQ